MQIIKIVSYIITVTLFLWCQQSVSAAERWGYAVHSSKLSKRYIHSEIKKYSVISLTGYYISKEGTVNAANTAVSKRILRTVKNYNIRWYPLIAFQSPATGHRILSNKRLRDKVGDTLAALQETVKCNGIHLDIEHLPSSDSGYIPLLLKRIRALKSSLYITMAIFPQSSYRSDRSDLHNLKDLARYLDQIVLMCYDLHDKDTGPGPVSAIGWAEENIKEAARYFRLKDIWLGTPCYGYKWRNNKYEKAVSSRYGMVLARRFGSKRNSSGNLHVKYRKGNRRYSVYFSDIVMRQRMYKLSKKYNLAGTAFWRLGLEDGDML